MLLARGALPLRLALRADESEEAYAGHVKQAQNCISKMSKLRISRRLNEAWRKSERVPPAC